MRSARPVTRGEVPEAFDEVADRYDLMVALNPGYHAHLRASADVLVASLASRAGSRSRRVARVVDLGCGSGASTRAVLDACAAADMAVEVIGVDGSAGMLQAARAKAWPAGVSFVQARAEELADRADLVGDGGLDAVFAAYLVRNVPDRDALLRALRAALAPGGVLVVHEYSVAGRRLPTAVWTAVCWAVVVPLGWLTSRRTRLYRYLWRSVLDFDSTARLTQRLQQAGFEDVRTRSVSGWQRGIIHTFHARRPAPRPVSTR
ncbi:MAG TPA: class I SAM-dependent methyltransferase [Intrasporangium sp.]|uniref:class I SAM-dependent methyltransferase n=1 Tax=Intrasporangium sp. TaxID=1925024 RepID=UPI002D76FA88|nr:class I SAM-dependent methyltransferase [Intrasporangium sp.]HET7398660.1 class I SAM-dependent methyltransferase [Intrasporangium sp.]